MKYDLKYQFIEKNSFPNFEYPLLSGLDSSNFQVIYKPNMTFSIYFVFKQKHNNTFYMLNLTLAVDLGQMGSIPWLYWQSINFGLIQEDFLSLIFKWIRFFSCLYSKKSNLIYLKLHVCR